MKLSVDLLRSTLLIFLDYREVYIPVASYQRDLYDPLLALGYSQDEINYDIEIMLSWPLIRNEFDMNENILGMSLTYTGQEAAVLASSDFVWADAVKRCSETRSAYYFSQILDEIIQNR